MLWQVIHDKVQELLYNKSVPYLEGPIPFDPADHPYLASHIQGICLCDTDFETRVAPGMLVMEWQVHLVFTLLVCVLGASLSVCDA